MVFWTTLNNINSPQQRSSEITIEYVHLNPYNCGRQVLRQFGVLKNMQILAKALC